MPDIDTAGATDALAWIKADHDTITRLLRAFDAIDADSDDADERKAELIDDLCYELTVHAMLEEEIFYPALRAAGRDDELLDEAEGEHAGLHELVGQLEVMYPNDVHFAATVAVLGDEFWRHVEKEESELFNAARKAGIDLDALGALMAARRRALDADLTAPPLPADADGAQIPEDSQQTLPAQQMHEGVRRVPRPPN